MKSRKADCHISIKLRLRSKMRNVGCWGESIVSAHHRNAVWTAWPDTIYCFWLFDCVFQEGCQFRIDCDSFRFNTGLFNWRSIKIFKASHLLHFHHVRSVYLRLCWLTLHRCGKISITDKSLREEIVFAIDSFQRMNIAMETYFYSSWMVDYWSYWLHLSNVCVLLS